MGSVGSVRHTCTLNTQAKMSVLKKNLSRFTSLIIFWLETKKKKKKKNLQKHAASTWIEAKTKLFDFRTNEQMQ